MFIDARGPGGTMQRGFLRICPWEPGQQRSLKVRPDGTVVDGHHRIKILCDCGVDVEFPTARDHSERSVVGIAAPQGGAMRTNLFWIPGPWPGRLAIMPRPRGGDWLADEIQSWRRANGIEFISFPIVDRAVPTSMAAFRHLVTALADQLAAGKNIAIHCRQGIGRAALVAVCTLITSGIEWSAAIERVASARGCTVPETPEQVHWIADFANSLVTPAAKQSGGF